MRRDSAGLPDTAALAARLAEQKPANPATVYLCGEVGAGKSEFARAMIRQLGVAGSIPSPSFALVQLYECDQMSIGHFDFYRCTDLNEWRAAGLDETIAGLDLAIIEWPERSAGLPAPDLQITIVAGQLECERNLAARAYGAGNCQWLQRAWC